MENVKQGKRKETKERKALLARGHGAPHGGRDTLSRAFNEVGKPDVSRSEKRIPGRGNKLVYMSHRKQARVAGAR